MWLIQKSNTFEPPIAPGKMDPVSWYRASIFDTQPWLTRNCRDISHGRIPKRANSTMRKRVWFGNGRPFTNTPPSWFTSPYCCDCDSKTEEKRNENRNKIKGFKLECKMRAGAAANKVHFGGKRSIEILRAFEQSKILHNPSAKNPLHVPMHLALNSQNTFHLILVGHAYELANFPNILPRLLVVLAFWCQWKSLRYWV